MAAADERQRPAARTPNPPRFGPRFPALRRSPGPPAAPLVTPDLRARPRSPARCPCRLHRSDVPRPRHPSQVSSQDELAQKQAELQELQDRLRAASVNKRKLDITLYLTGAKAEQLKPKPVRGRVSETQRTAHGLAHASASSYPAPPYLSSGARDREGLNR